MVVQVTNTSLSRTASRALSVANDVYLFLCLRVGVASWLMGFFLRGCQSVCLCRFSDCLFIVCPLSACLSVCLSVWLFVCCLCVCLCVCLLPVCLFVCSLQMSHAGGRCISLLSAGLVKEFLLSAVCVSVCVWVSVCLPACLAFVLCACTSMRNEWGYR